MLVTIRGLGGQTLPATPNVLLNNDERDGRTPARKLVKDDISSTSVLIRGCTTQKCCDEPVTILTDV
ncbi:MAG: hypothetical protein LC800_00535 [Acidobacteria bacterium]|nr:hypothetical protein [Acidobacteriota bacterium]